MGGMRLVGNDSVSFWWIDDGCNFGYAVDQVLEFVVVRNFDCCMDAVVDDLACGVIWNVVG